MLAHPLTRTRPLVRLTFGVGAFALLVCAPAAAQSPGEAASDYRLTMPVLRKAIPALYAAGKESCTRRHRDQRELAEMTVAQMASELDGCAPVQRAAAAQGISTLELAQVSKALMQVGHRISEEESAKVTGGTPPALPSGVLRDNVSLVRQNEAELGRLTGQHQP